jgi:glycosyltransferase involved in cell wall biosynthesis
MGIDAYTKQYYKNCSKIICLNEFARQDFEEFTNDPEKLVVIPNGHIFRKIHKEVNMKDGKYRLLFPGYLSERKNQLFLINMMKHLTTDKKVELLFAGTFLVENYRKDIMKAIKNLPKNREVKLLGYVEHEKLLDMYKDIHYFVSAALAEVQSLAVIESLASGTPVIGLENTTTTELIQNNENGYILNSESSPKEFADKLSEYLEISEEKYEKLSKRSKESVEFLDYSRISENYVDFYSDLITQPIDSRRKIISIKEVVKFFRIEEVEQKSKRYKNNVFLVIASSLVAIALAFVSVLNWVKRNKKE